MMKKKNEKKKKKTQPGINKISIAVLPGVK
jgi:hypothetical protein